MEPIKKNVFSLLKVSKCSWFMSMYSVSDSQLQFFHDFKFLWQNIELTLF